MKFKIKKDGIILLSFWLIFSLTFISATGPLDSAPTGVVGNVTNALGWGNTWRQVIISLVVLAIILAGIYDILELTSIFDNSWVKIIISVGLGIIASLIGWINAMSTFLFEFAAAGGAIAIAVEIIVSMIVFIGLSVGNSYIAKWAAKRKAQKEEIKAIKGAGKASAAIEGLGQIQDAFKKNS